MHHCQPNAVQSNGLVHEGLAATIFPVTNNRTANFGKLQPNLVFPSGVEANFNERSQWLLAQRSITQPGMLRPFAPWGDRLHPPLAIVFQHPVRKLSFVWLRSALGGLDQCPVNLFELAALKLLRQTVGRFARAGQYQDAADRRIESAHDPQIDVSRLLVL